jgi:hypothetical protein
MARVRELEQDQKALIELLTQVGDLKYELSDDLKRKLEGK